MVSWTTLNPWSSLVAVLLALTLFSSSICAARNSKGRSSEDRSSYHSKEPNVCELGRNERAFCYCDNNDLAEAKEASCWVFNDCKADDPLWDVFATQPEIRRIKILVRPQSDLQFIPTRALRYLKRLKVIEVQYARIAHIPPHAFANLSFLDEIQISRNQIEKLQPGAFSTLPSLKILNLDENRIAILERGTFEGASSLNQLFLSHNNITEIEEGAFGNLHHLHELVLANNGLASLSKRAFHGLVRLEQLDLSFNQLQELPAMIFSEMPGLKELELDSNGLQVVNERAFEGLSNLERLSLGSNQLINFNSHAIQGVPGLRTLDLRDNKLRTLTRNTIEPMMDNLRNAKAYLLLSGNMFECDCRLSWVHSLHNETHSEPVRNSLEELTCTLSGGTVPGGRSMESSVELRHSSSASSSSSNRVRITHGRRGSVSLSDYDEDEEMDDEAALPPISPSAASLGPPIKHLLELSPESLPCPSENTAPPINPVDLMFPFSGMSGTSPLASISFTLALLPILLMTRLW